MGDNMRALFVGDLLARKGRDLMERYEDDPLRKGKRKRK